MLSRHRAGITPVWLSMMPSLSRWVLASAGGMLQTACTALPRLARMSSDSYPPAGALTLSSVCLPPYVCTAIRGEPD